MNVKTKRRSDTDRQKEERKEKVMIAAIEVFKEKGIENAKMTDIAEKAAIGVASVYRYFRTKPELVIAAAVKFWDLGLAALSHNYAEAVLHEWNGLAQVRQILQVSFTVYHEHQDFIRFLEELDYYILKEQIGFAKLAVYENNIFHAKTLLCAALETGKRDGSIRPDVDNNRFCITITRALMSLCQKLALRGIVLPSDSEIAGEVQLGILVDMAVRYIQK